MIGFFPDPYPDELFYSICARYGRRVGYQSQTHTTYDLFGARILVAIALPSNLSHLISVLPPGHRHTVDQLIDEHTLLPFYAPFLPPERVVKVRESMAEDSGGKRTHSAAGVLARGNSQHETFRYCPACVTEDRRRYGETYWHRAHQAPRVIVCPRHAVWLEPSDVYLHSRDRIAIKRGVCPAGVCALPTVACRACGPNRMSPGDQLAFAEAAVTAKKINNVSRVEDPMGE